MSRTLTLLWILPSLAGGFSSTTVQAAEAIQFVPSSPWSVDFADDSCNARRTFVNGEHTVLLEFESLGPSPSVGMRIASNSLRLRPRTPVTQFLPSAAEPKSHEFFQNLEANGWQGVSVQNVPMPTNEMAITAFSVKRVFRDDIVLTTGPLDEIMKVMRKCEDELFSTLGLDVEAHRALSRPLEITGDEEWLRVTAPMQRDFAVTKGSTFQRVRLLVDEQGQVTSCRVLGWPEGEPIARNMCDTLLSRAKLAPALDAQSRPIKSVYILRLFSAVETRSF